MPTEVGQAGVAPIRVPLLVSNRDEVVAHLAAHKVQADDIWYDIPVSPRRLYNRVEYPIDECPNAVKISQRLMNMPTHERITGEDIQRISRLVNEVAES